VLLALQIKQLLDISGKHLRPRRTYRNKFGRSKSNGAQDHHPRPRPRQPALRRWHTQTTQTRFLLGGPCGVSLLHGGLDGGHPFLQFAGALQSLTRRCPGICLMMQIDIVFVIARFKDHTALLPAMTDINRMDPDIEFALHDPVP
jgi:hypothetical protein